MLTKEKMVKNMKQNKAPQQNNIKTAKSTLLEKFVTKKYPKKERYYNMKEVEMEQMGME